MTVFCYKKTAPTMRFGDKIKKTREERGLDLTKVSELTHVPLKYIQAIESGSFDSLPKTKAHRHAYVREICGSLSLSPDDCLKQFENEAGFESVSSPAPKQGIKLLPFASISIFLRNIVAISLVLFFAGYLIWQVKGILEPPYLAVFSPSEGTIFTNPRAVIEGQTEKESKLTVNGQEIMLSEEGKFLTEIDLSVGLNTIEILATKKHGKTTSIIRHIVVKSSSPTGDPITLK